MSFSQKSKIRFKITWLTPGLALLALALALVLVSAGAWAQATSADPSVETYVDQALPTPAPAQALPQEVYPSAPVTPGEITMKDVLKAHPKLKPVAVQPPVLPAAPATSSLLSPNSKASSANIMLMQGMQSALQENGSSTTPLKPPTAHYYAGSKAASGGFAPDATAPIPVAGITPDAAASASAASPVAAIAPTAAPGSSANGLTYEPGQEPKNLAGSAARATTVTSPSAAQALPTTPNLATSALSAFPVPAPETAATAQASSDMSQATPGCAPQSEPWIKTCGEAGYPENFVGRVRGETHTVCPGGTLKDVWVANNCAPPNSGEPSSDTGSEQPAAATMSTGAMAGAPTEEAVIGGGSQAMVPSENMIAPATMMPAAQPIDPRADASCGAANGLASTMAPVSELCSSGEATEVSGAGPWRWSCRGHGGGMTVSCAAPATATGPLSPASMGSNGTAPAIVIEDGQCGMADGLGSDHAPAANLCAKGVASHVSGDGPWTWACSGSNGGQAAACHALLIANGVCGHASGTAAEQMPVSDLCAAGYASAVTGNGPWNWTCSGLNGGSATTCSAAPRQDAVCGPASLGGHRTTPREELCSVGTASAVSGKGPWDWTCSGSNGGSTVSCSSSLSMNGVCGPANGVAASEAPSENLCHEGQPTRVVGSGPWTWNCSGTDGGDTQSCTAPVGASPQTVAAATSAASASVASPSATGTASNDMCGAAADLAALAAPERDLCSSGTAGGVSGEGPWSWTCTDAAGHSASCSTLSVTGNLTDVAPAPAKSASVPVTTSASGSTSASPAATAVVENKLACGSSAGQGMTQAPVEDLCAVGGKASAVHGSGPWTWSCAKGKQKVSCEATKRTDGACGTANGSTQRSVPASGLCASGNPTDIQGTGPWLWSCVGSGGGASASCSAASQAQTRVDGSCGAASNTPSSATPSANLCDSGTSSAVYGEGPWTWTCSGLNGGIASTCSAQRNVPPAPPPPGPPLNGLCGSANGVAMVIQPMDDLCSAGTPTGVSGNGPWNWNCLGANGGMTVSCTAPLQPPAPITGVCGAANGVPTLTTPRSGLCSAGISSAVSGRGPWTWSCSGTNGGGAVGCVAPLAGTGGGGSLPSLSTTPSADESMAAPNGVPMQIYGSDSNAGSNNGLVTPHLPTGPLPPLETGSMPQLTPSKAFDAPPEASSLPPVPVPGEMLAPGSAPDLPSDEPVLTPPAIRDTLKPSPALRAPSLNVQGQMIPGNHFTLPDDVSTIAFVTGSENISNDTVPSLNKLAMILQANSNVRVTLTAYAGVAHNTAPREARRLSLTRALAVRDYLTAKGISSGRLDVRALGANVSSGDPDRVDVTAN